MSEEKGHSGSEEVSILSILQQIKEGVKDPGSLTKEDRQRCVEVLKFQNQSLVQIAWLLKCSEKTVSRDIAAIRKRNAMSPDVGWAREFVGETDQQVQSQLNRLSRIATSGDSKDEDKINADALIWKIRREYAQVMQTLGYLPARPSELIVSHQSEEPTLEEIEKTVAEIQSISEETGTDDERFKDSLEKIRSSLEKSKLARDAATLLEQQKKIQNAEEKSHE